MDHDAISAWGLRNGDALVLQALQSAALPAAAPIHSTNQVVNGSAAVGSSNPPGVLPDGRCGTESPRAYVHDMQAWRHAEMAFSVRTKRRCKTHCLPYRRGYSPVLDLFEYITCQVYMCVCFPTSRREVECSTAQKALKHQSTKATVDNRQLRSSTCECVSAGRLHAVSSILIIRVCSMRWATALSEHVRQPQSCGQWCSLLWQQTLTLSTAGF